MSEEEKLMITIELEKPWDKSQDPTTIRDLCKTSLMFIETFKKTNDLRFLNTALKINDIIRKEKKMIHEDLFSKLMEKEKGALKKVEEGLIK
ncbi:MAG: hypothetical protein ACFFCS_13350 [Candidatus Hodarchaeota archaeon]